MKKKKKLNKIKLFIFLLILCSFPLFYKWITHFNKQSLSNLLNTSDNSSYEVIKKDKNEKYDGVGMQMAFGKDGYLSTFTTTQNHKKTYLEYKQNR